MPLYEYRCGECGERFEVLQRMGEDGHGLTCPACGAEAAQRQLSTFAAATGGDVPAAGCGAPSGFT